MLLAVAVLGAGLLALVGAKPAWAAEPSFAQAQNYPVGPYSYSVTAADFDGDGKDADLAVTTDDRTVESTLDNVAVLSGNGDGTFAAAQDFGAGLGPRAVISADFDRDGKADLAVLNGSDNVSVLLGNGDDTFRAARYYPVGDDPFEMTTADFNGDSKADLAVSNRGSDNVSVLLGNGDGTFGAAKNFAVGDYPVSVTSGDFDGDGIADLATADDPIRRNIADSVSVLSGRGDGTFRDAQRFTFQINLNSWHNLRQVITTDFNRDGKADLAVATTSDGISLLLGNGDGTFRAGQKLDGDYYGLWGSESLTAADFNHDGRVDIASASSSSVSVLTGRGNGAFNPAQRYSVDAYPAFIISEDLNGDNYADLAVSHGGSGCCSSKVVSVLLNTPTSPPDTTITSGQSEPVDDPDVVFKLASSESASTLADSSVADAGDTTRASVDSSGAQVDISVSSSPSISADGRYVAFISTSPDLVEGDTNNATDVFVRDLQEGTTRRVSVDDPEAEGKAGRSFAPSISADGRYVVFTSAASDLVLNDTNGYWDVFVRDLQEGTTELASVDSSEAQADYSSSNGDRPSISADGRYVVFSSYARNLVPNDPITTDVYIRDLREGTTEMVSVGRYNDSTHPSISADGRYVAFTSWSSIQDATGVFVHDRQTRTTQLVGAECAPLQCGYPDDPSTPSISTDGRYVAFSSNATDLVAPETDTNGLNDIFVRDRDTDGDGTFDEPGAVSTERVTVGGCAIQATGGSYFPSISADGRYVTFTSQASNLVANDTNASPDVFVRDRQMKTTQRVSIGSSGTQAHLGGNESSISSDGHFVAFTSQARDLVGGDTNGFRDVFVHERRDTTALSECITPTTTASAITDSGDDYSSGTWTYEGVKVTLSAQDNEGGSGVKEITYSATGAQTIASTTVLAGQLPKQLPNINTGGTTTVSYFATDNEGNSESPKTFTVRIDRSAPTSSATARDSDGNSYTSGTLTSKNVTVALNASDGSGSGVKDIAYSINGGAIKTYNPTNKIPVSSEGVSTISYFATDNVGNRETPAKTFEVKLDKSAPILNTVTPDNRQSGVSRNIEPTATFSDEMNPASLITSAKLKAWNAKKQVWQPVPVAVSVEDRTATLDPYPTEPSRLLVANKRFKVTITTGAKNLAGLPMSSPKSWTFTTGSS